MCGIVGYIGEKNSTDILVDGLKKLEYRGYDSAGVSVFEKGNIKTVKAKGRLDDLEKRLKQVGYPVGTCGIGHTRWATHGEPSDVNSHPHESEKVSVVHNGIIENYMKLKEFLIAKGYKFVSETDTETIAYLLDLYYDKDPIDAIKKAMEKLEGSFALGILFHDTPDKIFAVRKESPLIVGLGIGENFLASDIPAILKYTKNYYLLDKDEIAILTKEDVVIIDLDGNTLNKEVQVAAWDIEAAEKCGYEHFMLKEMFEEPTALRNTILPRIVDGLPSLGVDILNTDKNINKIYVVACGTAMHAGLLGKAVIENMARVPVEVDIASEFRYKNPIITDKDLVIIISQSGETADTLAALRLAKSKGAHTLAVVNVVGSSIAREADSAIYTWAGPEIAIASTKAYSVQICVMYMIAMQMALVKGEMTETQVRTLTKDFVKIPNMVEQILGKADEIREVAKEIIAFESLFFIGRGLDFALSIEGALKLKEISYIHSEAYAAGELKHGTISLITPGVPVIASATQRELLPKTISNIKEVKARGAKVILLCHEGMENAEQVADIIIELPEFPDIFMPPLAILPLQLLAYYASVLRGCDVDKPRNLAKSVTVE